MKYKITIIILLTLGLVCMSLVSCKQNQTKIGMLIASPVFKPDLTYFSSLISKEKYSVISADANYDDKLQIAQATSLINQGIKILVIVAVNTNTAAAIVRLANERNIKNACL